MKQVKKKENRQLGSRLAWQNSFPVYVVFAGLAGLTGSLALALEKIASLENPARQALCDINPILSCGSVMNSAQATTFGIPHSLIGLAVFGGLTAFGILLLAGAKVKTWLWHTALAGITIGVLVVQYLVYQSLFVLRTLCPWCLVIWFVVMPLFLGLVAYGVRRDLYPVSSQKLATILRYIEKHNVTILIVWLIIIFYLILGQFWFYWSTLLIY